VSCYFNTSKCCREIVNASVLKINYSTSSTVLLLFEITVFSFNIISLKEFFRRIFRLGCPTVSRHCGCAINAGVPGGPLHSIFGIFRPQLLVSRSRTVTLSHGCLSVGQFMSYKCL